MIWRLGSLIRVSIYSRLFSIDNLNLKFELLIKELAIKLVRMQKRSKNRKSHKKNKNATNLDQNDVEQAINQPEGQIFEQGDYEKHQGIMDDPEELQHFKNVISAFFNYKVYLLFE